MPPLQPGKLLRIMMTSDDRYGGKPAYEAVVDRCRELGIAGATVFAGIEGFGESAELVRPHGFERAKPIVITIVENDENIARLLPELEIIAAGSLFAITPVDMIRVENGPAV